MIYFLEFIIGTNITSDPISLKAHMGVLFIYLLFFIMLCYFHYILLLYFSSNTNEKKIFLKKNSASIDFLINYSVALGVMGTLVSIGIAFANSDGNATETIGKYFGTALYTTAIGISFYGYFFVWHAILVSLGVSNE